MQVYRQQPVIVLGVSVAFAWLCIGVGTTTAGPQGSAAGKEASARKRYLRVDFELQGVSCAACILGVEKALRKQKAVKKVGVSVYKPHKGVVIFLPEQTSFNDLIKAAKKREADVRFVNVKETSVDTIPLILIPAERKVKD